MDAREQCLNRRSGNLEAEGFPFEPGRAHHHSTTQRNRLRPVLWGQMGTKRPKASPGTATVELSAAAPTFLQARQERGKMEFSGFPRKKIAWSTRFRLTVEPDTGS